MSAPLDRAGVAALTRELPTLDDPADAAGWLALLRLLHTVGRRDLPLGRVFEGHVDALGIVGRYGTPAQRGATQAAARAGAVLGVWNADGVVPPLRMEAGQLSGGKAFASGAGVLSHALVTVDADGGRQLLLLDLAAVPPAIDRGWWRVTGMVRSETHLVTWDAAPVPADALIGRPGDYVREPWFGGGALRFAAVQAGGIAAVADGLSEHLRTTGRAGDPHQAGRLAEAYLLAQGAADATTRAARAWHPADIAGTLAHVAAARAAVYAAGERVLALAQAAIGVQAMFVDHPLAPMLADLSVYLRQPGPDAQRMRVGEAVAAGLLRVEP